MANLTKEQKEKKYQKAVQVKNDLEEGNDRPGHYGNRETKKMIASYKEFIALPVSEQLRRREDSSQRWFQVPRAAPLSLG